MLECQGSVSQSAHPKTELAMMEPRQGAERAHSTRERSSWSLFVFFPFRFLSVVFLRIELTIMNAAELNPERNEGEPGRRE